MFVMTRRFKAEVSIRKGGLNRSVRAGRVRTPLQGTVFFLPPGFLIDTELKGPECREVVR